MAGSHEVRGSIPLGSTINSIGDISLRFFYTRIIDVENRVIGQKVCLILGVDAGQCLFFVRKVKKIDFSTRTKSVSGY